MKVGKLSQTVWKRTVLKQLNQMQHEQILQPDGTEYAQDRRGLSISSTASGNGISDRVVHYVVLQALEQLQARGVDPEAISVQIYLPEYKREKSVERILCGIQQICEKESLELLQFQAEVNPAVSQNLIHVTASGIADPEVVFQQRYVKPGQSIILCGTIALEGMLRILDEREKELKERFSPAFLRQMHGLEGQLDQLQALREIRDYAALNHLVDDISMFPIGSGGIFAALWDITESNQVGMKIDLNSISVFQETIEVCEYYQLNPFQMTSTGAVLIVTENGDAIMNVLEKAGARASRLGVTTADHAKVITSGEEIRYLDRPAPDELMRWWQEQNKRSEERYGR